MDHKMRILVIIVNYRTPLLTIDCLRSLEGEIRDLPGTQVSIVDNDSPDESVPLIRQAIKDNNWESWATLWPSKHNGGYAFGNNLAIRPALQTSDPPHYFWLLNPDTVVKPRALQTLVEFLEAHPQAGIAGSQFEHSDGKPWPFAFRFPSFWSELDEGLRLGVVTKLLSHWTITRSMPNQPCQVDWLPGASMLIRREVFASIGLMDESYFLYYEETDFFLRAHRAGWTSWYIPESLVIHFCGQSTGVTGNNSLKRRPKYWFESRQRYFVKNHGWAYTLLTDAAWISGHTLWQMRQWIQQKDDKDPPYFFQDFIANSLLFSSPIFKKGSESQKGHRN